MFLIEVVLQSVLLLLCSTAGCELQGCLLSVKRAYTPCMCTYPRNEVTLSRL
jgi:hypothetical protein